MVRYPMVAGQFYPAGFDELDKQIHACFLDEHGPGVLPMDKRKGKVKGIVVPHAGYTYSGPCAAWAYKEIAEAEFPDLFIIIGPNHYGIGRSSTILDDWKTPFGLVKCDKEFAKGLVQHSELALDTTALEREHSIEVQLPFLQFVSKDNLQSLRIVPIVVSGELSIKRFALDLKEYIMESNKSVCIIASSDFTHYGPAYGYIPFELDKQRKIYELDAGAIKLIKAQDVEGFLDYVKTTGATICGYLGIAIQLLALPKSKIRLLQYYTSGDIVHNYRNAVGYASMVIE